MTIYHLSEENNLFPDPNLAEPDGLIAVGGDLSTKRLVAAYKAGIFPWFNSNDPVLWWSPDPRLVLFPNEIKISKSTKKILKKQMFNITVDTVFKQVITKCSKIRTDRNIETWLNRKMIDAYSRLYRKGLAHSVEVWYENELAGGLYGIVLGRSFFGESMFSTKSNASKIALIYLSDMLSKLSFDMIDCQVKSTHLLSLGAREIKREYFLKILKQSIEKPAAWISTN